ncbi:hypothetical protein [Leptospira ryugenii]|uniref:hypothetical protein n=1 Tax=Leptospira ryugenii TaxID=1917863 RepID=UPI000D593694|nr:hypothetical protein [Leptospira ryugenii]
MKLKLLFLFFVWLAFENCSNTGSRSESRCNNQCLADQALCVLLTNQSNQSTKVSPSYSPVCAFFYMTCTNSCKKSYVSSGSRGGRSSGGSSGGGGRRGSSGGGGGGRGSSGGGGGGSSGGGGGHGGGGH